MSAVFVWRSVPRSRIQKFVILHGDKMPVDPLRASWWSDSRLEVEWISKGYWTWTVFAPLYRGTGSAIAWGDALSSNDGKAQAARAGLAMLNNLPEEAREAMIACVAACPAEARKVVSAFHKAEGEAA